MALILLVADRKTTIDSLADILSKDEHELVVASNQRRALQVVRQNNPDLVIVDMTSAKLSGGKVCLSLRRTTETPILAIMREPPDSNHEGAPLADEWLVKPFSAQDLLTQVRRLLIQSHLLVLGPVALNLRAREVRVGDGEAIRLPPKQYALLRCLMKHPGQTLTRAQLMREVWETDFLDDTRTLDVHIRWLREKIEPNPSAPIYIQTVRRVGYRFVPKES